MEENELRVSQELKYWKENATKFESSLLEKEKELKMVAQLGQSLLDKNRESTSEMERFQHIMQEKDAQIEKLASQLRDLENTTQQYEEESENTLSQNRKLQLNYSQLQEVLHQLQQDYEDLQKNYRKRDKDMSEELSGLRLNNEELREQMEKYKQNLIESNKNQQFLRRDRSYSTELLEDKTTLLVQKEESLKYALQKLEDLKEKNRAKDLEINSIRQKMQTILEQYSDSEQSLKGSRTVIEALEAKVVELHRQKDELLSHLEEARNRQFIITPPHEILLNTPVIENYQQPSPGWSTPNSESSLLDELAKSLPVNFNQTLIKSKSESIPKAHPSLSPAERKEVTERIVRNEITKNRYKKMEHTLNEQNQELADIKTKWTNSMEDKIRILNEKKSLEFTNARISSELSELRKMVGEGGLEKERDHLKEEISNLRRESEKRNQKFQQHLSNTANEEKKLLEKSLREKDERISKLQEQMKEIQKIRTRDKEDMENLEDQILIYKHEIQSERENVRRYSIGNFDENTSRIIEDVREKENVKEPNSLKTKKKKPKIPKIKEIIQNRPRSRTEEIVTIPPTIQVKPTVKLEPLKTEISTKITEKTERLPNVMDNSEFRQELPISLILTSIWIIFLSFVMPPSKLV